ncbi:MAG: microtubule-binding protein [Bdellovibrionales bacterium]
MAFNYRKHKEQSANDSFWTSYSDLFLGLSTIFLLLYVVASLRTSTDAIQSEIQNRRLTMRVQDLENQLKMYNSIRKDYLDNSASPSEATEYRELMDKLTLLKEEAKDEKERLQREALENSAKETALNKYQQMIRNVINANKVAKTKLATREVIIDEQHEEIGNQGEQMAQLQKEVKQKQALITKNEHEIQSANLALDKKMTELKKARKQNHISNKLFEQRMAKLREESQEQVDQLRDANERHQKNLRAVEGKLGALNGELTSTKRTLAKQAGESADLRGQLAKAKAEADARQEIARLIKKGFAANGVKADIDMETGDVLIDFGDHYFEVNSAELKVEMKVILDKAMPAYSKSLFDDPKVAKQISAVEVIGFASPTYHGRFIDPRSSKSEDKDALKYNMDLSYRRAKSIFNYVLDEKKMKFEHQTELVPLMKVSGRSFLEVFKDTRTIASGQEFCKVHDCKKAQRVIIRFNMDRKK